MVAGQAEVGPFASVWCVRRELTVGETEFTFECPDLDDAIVAELDRGRKSR